MTYQPRQFSSFITVSEQSQVLKNPSIGVYFRTRHQHDESLCVYLHHKGRAAMTSFRRKRIGDILIAKRLVTQAQIDAILAKTDGTSIRLGERLVEDGLVSDEMLAQSLAEQRDLRYADLTGFRISSKFQETIPHDLMQRYQFVPLEDDGELLVVAMADPNNVPAIDELEMILNRQLEICVSTLQSIKAVLKRTGPLEPMLAPAPEEFLPPLSKEEEDSEVEETISFATFDKPQRPQIKNLHTTKNLIIVGDRVLVDPDEGLDKTPSGLYLPPTVKEKEKILGGKVVKVGPGYAIPDTTPAESWTTNKKEVKYLPLQAVEGDYAIFLKESAIELEFEEKKYLIVPHSAILVLARTELSGGH
jgi:co-chaperonin GroES (HSP10)